MTIKRQYIGSRKSRAVEYRYTIRQDGKTLTRRASAVIFTTEKQAQEFIERVESGAQKLDAEYRWM